MIADLKEHVEVLLAAAASETEARDLGDHLVGYGMGVWLSMMDLQGIPRDRAFALMLKRCEWLTKQLAEVERMPLDA